MDLNTIITTIKNEGLTLSELDELITTKEIIELYENDENEKANELLSKLEDEYIEELEKNNIKLKYNDKKDVYEFFVED